MNPYEILGIQKDATIEDIKKSYRSLSKLYHPDRPEGDVEKFKEITGAYEVLSDVDKRKHLDLSCGATDQSLRDLSCGATDQSLRDLQMPMPTQPQLDIYCTVSADLADLYKGVIKKFKVNRYQYSSYAEPILEEKYLEVKIPPGFPSGESLILLGEGNRFNGYGNIIIKVLETTTRTLFKREGVNLIYPVKISLRRALCGFQLNIIHLDGRKITISIDEVINPGMQHIIQGEGMPYVSLDNIKPTPSTKPTPTKRGDLIVVFDVEFPRQLSKDHKDLLNRLLQF